MGQRMRQHGGPGRSSSRPGGQPYRGVCCTRPQRSGRRGGAL